MVVEVTTRRQRGQWLRRGPGGVRMSAGIVFLIFDPQKTDLSSELPCHFRREEGESGEGEGLWKLLQGEGGDEHKYEVVGKKGKWDDAFFYVFESKK